MSLRHRLWRLALAFPGSLVFCLRNLPLHQAVKLPIVVAHTVARNRNSGTVRIEGPVRPGMIRIGFGGTPLFDFRRARGVWDVIGEVVFEGPAEISHGVKLSVSGRLVLGSGVILNAETRIVCLQEIVLGPGAKVSWDVMIMDSDMHSVSGAHPDAPVAIGEHVMVGAHAVILKGVQLPKGCVVAAASCVTRSLKAAEADLIAGNPARVIRSGVTWEF